MTVAPCPHCGEPCGPSVTPTHVCADKDPWTREEKDEMRVLIRRWHPAVTFAPSTSVMQDRFGDRNRREREAGS